MLPPRRVLLDCAAILQALADRLEHYQPPPQAAPVRDDFRRAIDTIAYWVSRGIPTFDAIDRAAAAQGAYTHAELRAAWAEHGKLRQAAELHAKRLIVDLLTAQGWSNRRIAVVVGVHEKHIPRMRRAMEPKGLGNGNGDFPK